MSENAQLVPGSKTIGSFIAMSSVSSGVQNWNGSASNFVTNSWLVTKSG